MTEREIKIAKTMGGSNGLSSASRELSGGFRFSEADHVARAKHIAHEQAMQCMRSDKDYEEFETLFVEQYMIVYKNKMAKRRIFASKTLDILY